MDMKAAENGVLLKSSFLCQFSKSTTHANSGPSHLELLWNTWFCLVAESHQFQDNPGPKGLFTGSIGKSTEDDPCVLIAPNVVVGTSIKLWFKRNLSWCFWRSRVYPAWTARVSCFEPKRLRNIKFMHGILQKRSVPWNLSPSTKNDRASARQPPSISSCELWYHDSTMSLLQQLSLSVDCKLVCTPKSINEPFLIPCLWHLLHSVRTATSCG